MVTVAVADDGRGGGRDIVLVAPYNFIFIIAFFFLFFVARVLSCCCLCLLCN